MLRIGFLTAAITAAVLAQDNAPTGIYAVLNEGLTVRWRDDATGHPDLLAFRDYLKKAARQHDLKAILYAADPDFRGCDMRGVNDLRKLFSDTPSGTGSWWPEFYKALTEGGVLSADGKSFDSNYAVWTFPTEKTGVFGPENFRVISGPSVAVLERPDSSSRPMERLSYSLVIPEEPLVETGWQRVEFRKGQFGFVDSKYLIDPAGVLVRMGRRGGKWRFTGIATYCD